MEAKEKIQVDWNPSPELRASIERFEKLVQEKGQPERVGFLGFTENQAKSDTTIDCSTYGVSQTTDQCSNVWLCRPK